MFRAMSMYMPPSAGLSISAGRGILLGSDCDVARIIITQVRTVCEQNAQGRMNLGARRLV